MNSQVIEISLRDRILDAAELLLARYGYRKMTMDDLAAEAGIGKGTTYLHFSGKAEVALTTIDRMVERLERRFRTLLDDALDPPRLVEEMLILRVLHRFDAAEPYSKSLDEMLEVIRPQLLERRRDYFRREALLLAEAIARGQAAGLFAPGLAVAPVAESLIIATNALLPSSLSARELGNRADIETKIRRLARLLVAGLRFHPTSDPKP